MILEYARSPGRPRATADTVVAWKALVAGRLTVVEHFDSSHQRCLVAMLNPPERHASLALNAREAAVAELVGQGHSQKFVAYELGLQESQVSRSLRSALTRLGLARESDLVALVRTSAPDAGKAPGAVPATRAETTCPRPE